MTDEKGAQASGPALFFVEAGSGPLVVLLHGFPESSRSWKRQVPFLAAAGFRAVAPDLRGYARSPKPRGIAHYRIACVADDVVGLIESLDAAPCVLIGHDWGAAVAWHIAATRPELLRKLVILNVPPPGAILREVRRSTRQKLNMLYQLFFQLPLLPELFMKLAGRTLLRSAGRFTSEEIEEYAQQWRGSLTPMLNYYRAMRKMRSEIRAATRLVDTSTLLIHGMKEPVFLPASFEDLGHWVANVRVEHVERAGHFVQTDQPDRVNELLLDFIR